MVHNQAGNGHQRQRAILVIGAGRSGTSVIARCLAALGVDLGRNFKGASKKNPTGFFEDAELLELSKAVRRTIGIRPESVRLIEPAELQGPELADLHHRAAALIRRCFGDSPVWGFKYGRTLRILPFWEPVFRSLNIEPSYVLALRNPLSIARSRARLDPRRGRQEFSDLEWLVGVVPFLGRTRSQRLAVVDYDLLMDDPARQLQRLAACLELPDDGSRSVRIRTFAEKFLDAGLRHSRFDPATLNEDAEINPLARKAYLLLRGLATDRERWDEPDFQSRWQAVEEEVRGLASVLRLIDFSESDRRRAITSLLGPLQSFELLRNALKN